MRTLVADPRADFAAVNAAAFSALGVSSARFTTGRVRQSGARASARVTERFALPHVGTWSPTTTVRLVQRSGRWLVAWTPGTINPALGVGDRLAASENWPARAPILGAGGAPLTVESKVVVVGIVGSRIKSTRAVTRDLLGAGATETQVRLALAQAKAHPDYFDPVFQVSKARFDHTWSKTRPGVRRFSWTHERRAPAVLAGCGYRGCRMREWCFGCDVGLGRRLRRSGSVWPFVCRRRCRFSFCAATLRRCRLGLARRIPFVGARVRFDRHGR
jgi:hypothetical protein